MTEYRFIHGNNRAEFAWINFSKWFDGYWQYFDKNMKPVKDVKDARYQKWRIIK